VLGYGLDDRGFLSRQVLGIFLFTTASRPTLGPTQPPIQWVPGALSLELRRLGSKADHLPPSGAEVKERVELYLHYPNKPSWRGQLYLISHVPSSHCLWFYRPNNIWGRVQIVYLVWYIVYGEMSLNCLITVMSGNDSVPNFITNIVSNPSYRCQIF